MGLDMYLYKIKKSKREVGLQEILKVGHYLSWLDRRKERGYSLEDWCGFSEDEIDLDLLKEYESEFITRYYSWDTEKEYPNKRIDTMVCDWRKANQIHNWFVGNVQNGVDDCDANEVSKEQLEELLEICTNVLAHSKLIKGKVINGYTFENGKKVPIYQKGKTISDPSYAAEHLPSSSGFFFGSTDYDQWYYEDVKYTSEKLKEVLKQTDFDKEIVYYSSSW